MKAGLKPAFLLFLTFFSYSNIYAKDKTSKFSHNSYWLKLIHYKKFPWGYKSEIDFASFFISPNGKSNPDDELTATINNSNDPKIICKYPARFLWLNQIGLTNVNLKQCEDYQKWLEGLNAKSLSLVFASYYPENPASAFGHLFLKIDHEEKSHLPELDYIVNFAAAAEEDGGIMYAIKGLTGGYKGIFTIEKYYQKIQEYEIHESRDLWEFKLDLNEFEIQKVLAHLWELTYFSYFDYYFFDENCSYQILKLVEMAKDKDAHQGFSPYQIPEENLHQIIKLIGLKDAPNQRFSLFKQAQSRAARLKNEDQALLKSSIKNGAFDFKNSSVDLLDTFNYILQVKQSQKKPFGSNDKKLNHQILVELSKRESPAPIHLEKNLSPLEGHRSHKLSIGQARLNNQNYAIFKFKPAFHEMMDNDQSYLPNSNLNILGLEGRYSFLEEKFKLQEFILLETQVLSPYSLLSTKPSWGADFSMRSLNYLNCINCQAYQLKLSRGLSFNYLNDRLTVYALLHGQFNHLLHKEVQIKQFRIGPELEIGVIAKIFDQFKLRSLISQQYNFTEQFSPQSYLNVNQLAFYPAKNFSINLEMRRNFKNNSIEMAKLKEFLGLISWYY